MACFLCVLAIPAAIFIAATDDAGGTEAERYWPQWRGPLGNGVAPNANPPITWSERENIRWAIDLPGLGHSTPIVWEDHVFLTTAVPYGDVLASKYSNAPGAHDNRSVTHAHKFVVLAVARRDGAIAWERTVHQQVPHEAGHVSASLASASPVTDGVHLFAHFGSQGIYCLDLDGIMQWKLDLGDMKTKHGHGEGSSPVLHGNTLIVNWDHEGQSFSLALDKHTGEQLWKVDRDEATSWATPIVVDLADTPQVVISGTNRVRGYDLGTGRVIWECGGLSANVVASPVAANGMVYVASSYDRQAMLAIRLDGATGDITGTDQVVWKRTRRTPYVPSPLLYDGSLYFLSHYQNVLLRVDTLTGRDIHGPLRLRGIRNIYASPVGAASRVYITDLEGATIVISCENTPRILATNRLNDRFSASAAVAGHELYLRGQRRLYCIAPGD